MATKKRSKKTNTRPVIHCHKCKTQADCCRRGAWADIEEAKIIVGLGLKGEFFQLEKDSDFPSGYCIGTSYDDNPCTFLDPDGLCSIHKINYHLKPQSCKDFPYENGGLSPLAGVLCTPHRKKVSQGR